MNSRVKKAYDFFQKYPGHLKTATDDIADRLDLTYDEVAEGRDIYRNSKEDGEIVEYKATKNFKEKAEKVGARDKYERFLEEHNIDPDDIVQVYYKGKTNGTNFTVQTRFDQDEVTFDPVQAFKDSIKEYQPKDYSDLFSKNELIVDRAGMINLFDAHLDKICSLKDTDQQASIESNIKDFKRGFKEVLESVASKNPEIIYLPIGNDFFHTNDFTLTTKKGTYQADKVHVTGIEAFRIGLNLLRECIDMARSIAPVKIIPVRGNHDEDRIRYLLECLLIAYENQEDVDIIDTHKSRIYVRYGSWLFGFAHGDKGIKPKEYPSYMSTDKEGKKHWSEIDQGVFFLGHYHHEKRYEAMKNKDFKGCNVHFLRATGNMDSWHWEEGWTGIPRTAYGFVFDKNGERQQEFKVNL